MYFKPLFVLLLATFCFSTEAETHSSAPSRESGSVKKQGVVFECEASKLQEIKKKMNRLFQEYGWSDSIVEVQEKNGSLQFTLRGKGPKDTNTLDLTEREELGIENVFIKTRRKGKEIVVEIASNEEVVAGLLQKGRLTLYKDPFCSFENFMDHVGMRQSIAKAGATALMEFPEAGPIDINHKYWNKDFTVKKDVDVTDAIGDVLQGPYDYVVGCTTAVKLLMLQGIMDYMKEIPAGKELMNSLAKGDPLEDADLEGEVGEDGDLNAAKYLTRQFNVPHDNWVVGDWGYVKNPDKESSDVRGYEGSNIAYVGGGKFAAYYQGQWDKTLEELVERVYNWRSPSKRQELTPSRMKKLLKDPESHDRGMVSSVRDTPKNFPVLVHKEKERDKPTRTRAEEPAIALSQPPKITGTASLNNGHAPVSALERSQVAGSTPLPTPTPSPRATVTVTEGEPPPKCDPLIEIDNLLESEKAESEIVEVLIGKLKTPFTGTACDVRKRVIEALTELAPDEALKKALQSDQAYVRAGAIHALAEGKMLSEGERTALFVPLLKDGHPDVRWRAAWAIENTPNAIDALAKLGQKGVSSLVGILNIKEISDETDCAVIEKIRQLHEAGLNVGEAIDPIREKLKNGFTGSTNRHGFGSTWYEEPGAPGYCDLRVRAIKTLAKITPKETLIKNLSHEDKIVRAGAAHALMESDKFTNQERKNLLTPLLKDKEEAVKSRIVWNIEQLDKKFAEEAQQKKLDKQLDFRKKLTEKGYTPTKQINLFVARCTEKSGRYHEDCLFYMAQDGSAQQLYDDKGQILTESGLADEYREIQMSPYREKMKVFYGKPGHHIESVDSAAYSHVYKKLALNKTPYFHVPNGHQEKLEELLEKAKNVRKTLFEKKGASGYWSEKDSAIRKAAYEIEMAHKELEEAKANLIKNGAQSAQLEALLFKDYAHLFYLGEEARKLRW